jgi:K+-sensing histidine kinase KdpD
MEKLSTNFASPERSKPDELERQRKIFAEKNLHSALLDAGANCIIVLNKNRQIVYANDAFKNLFENPVNGPLIGKRPGEALNCQNAFTNLSGCGTSEFCKTCGAVQAILSSLSGNEDVQECRILIKDTNEALDLRVWTKPVVINKEVFSVFSFSDISNEKRRQTLERIFFHDVLNTTAAIKSYINILSNTSGKVNKELSSKATVLINRLLEEIQFQRDFSHAEINELVVNSHECNTMLLINDVTNQYGILPIADGKEIKIDSKSEDIYFISDSVLVSRILSNMMRNSLEATESGGRVIIGAQKSKGAARFYVHNASYMLPDVQAQVFHRSFSTKGKGRGLGTYSMKLLAERYLKGKVYFNSSRKMGTTFFAEFPLNFSD